jgi:hypothetical protein
VPTRRKFLFDCSALAAVILTAPTAVLADSTALCSKKRILDEISFCALANRVNTSFRIHAGSRTIQVVLTQVKTRREKPLKPGQRPPADAGNEKFSLVFSGAPGNSLTQDTYLISHETLGQFDLFIVPINTRTAGKSDFEAVVNRPRRQIIPANSNKG